MIVQNYFVIAQLVDEYLKGGGTISRLTHILGVKNDKYTLERIEKQDWTKKHVKKMTKAGIISPKKRRGRRKLIKDAEAISEEVIKWLDELGDPVKFCRCIGIRSPKTLKSRLISHTWTEQEKSILISKRILDDSF
jgi:hypothetical protein